MFLKVSSLTRPLGHSYKIKTEKVTVPTVSKWKTMVLVYRHEYVTQETKRQHEAEMAGAGAEGLESAVHFNHRCR